MNGIFEARVADYMTSEVLTIAPQTLLPDIERQFGLHDFNGFPVLEFGMLVGMVTKFDVLTPSFQVLQFGIPHLAESPGVRTSLRLRAV